MSTAIDPESLGWLRRARYTPMRDVVRGRMTGQLDLRAHIARAAVPIEARELVARIVRRTRLWPLEKIDVADELISHFADAIASGTSIDEAIRAFGDEKLSAKMIRRAKRRNRPIVWHALRAIGWCFTIVVCAYIRLSIRFFTGEPVPRVSYLDEVNRGNAAFRNDQRAWPLYREAMRGLAPMLHEPLARDEEAVVDAAIGSPKWPALVQWLDAHRDELKLIRDGAARPSAGFILTARRMSDPDSTLWPEPYASHGDPDTRISLPLAQIWDTSASIDMVTLMAVVEADARVAISTGDETRFTSDYEAIVGLARQLAVESFPRRVRGSPVLGLAEAALVSAPQMCGRETLRRIADELSRPTTAADVTGFDSDRLILRDVVQRAYTDDGSGDGRITFPKSELTVWFRENPLDLAKRALPMPLALTNAPGRRELINAYNSLLDRGESLLHQPIREANWDGVEQSLTSLESRLSALPNVMWALSSPRARHADAERYLGRRDGIITAIALELYRRDHDGSYPAALDDFVPKYMAAIPLDRIDGNPIRFRLIDGMPSIYSVGVDRDDDSGRSARKMDGEFVADRAARWPSKRTDSSKYTAPDGDWILFPQSPEILNAQTK